MEKNENVFKNPEGFTSQEISQMRVQLMNFAKSFVGRRFAIPLSDNLDLSYNRKVNGSDPGLATHKPIKKYYIETVDLVNIDLVRTANNKVVVMFNNDEKLQYDLRADISSIIKTTAKDVNDAILEYEATGKKSLFWDVRMVTNTIVNLNQSNMNDINNFVDELISQTSALESINKLTEKDTKDYYESIDETL